MNQTCCLGGGYALGRTVHRLTTAPTRDAPTGPSKWNGVCQMHGWKKTICTNKTRGCTNYYSGGRNMHEPSYEHPQDHRIVVDAQVAQDVNLHEACMAGKICQPSGSVPSKCIPGRTMRGWHKMPGRRLTWMTVYHGAHFRKRLPAETLADPYKGKTPLPRVPNYREPFASRHGIQQKSPNTWSGNTNQYLEPSLETHRIHSFPPIATE